MAFLHPGAYPNMGRGDQGEGAEQRVAVGAQQVQYGGGLALAGEAGEAIQDYASVDLALAEHELAGVLVRGQQKGAAPVRKVENLVVVDPRIKLSDVDDAMTCRPQGRNDWCIDVFVRYQVQRLGPQAASAATG
jgi:hypothetical protein